MNEATVVRCTDCETYVKMAATTVNEVWTCDCEEGLFVLATSLSTEQEVKEATPDQWVTSREKTENRV